MSGAGASRGEDLSSNPEHLHQLGRVVRACNPSTGRQRQVDAGSSLASSSNQLGELRLQ